MIYSDGYYQGSPDTLICGGCNAEVPIKDRGKHARHCADLIRLGILVGQAIERKHHDGPPRKRPRHGPRTHHIRARFSW